jgi:predicted metal-dependent peptidase
MSTKQDEAISLKIDRARWWALSEQPFYGALLSRLNPIRDDKFKGHGGTMCTDGRSIIYNGAFVESLSNEELRFVLLHEALHCAHGHLWRLPADGAGNIAGDHEINLTLSGQTSSPIPGITMPKGACCDLQYKGMSCEEIYNSLPKDDGDGGDGSGSGSGNNPCGSFTKPDTGQTPDKAAQDAQELRQDWEQAVIQAAQAAQALGRGAIPADLARQLERIKHQPIDWRQELAEFINQVGPSRSDWTRSPSRHAWQGVIYPRRRPSESPGLILICRDTSGSIDDQTLSMFNEAISNCSAEHPASSLLVVDCDAAICATYPIEPGGTLPTTAKGGGGTDFRPVFDLAKKLREDDAQSIAGVIYLTDLYGPGPAVVDIPTLWVCTTDQVAPTGRTIPISRA